MENPGLGSLSQAPDPNGEFVALVKVNGLSGNHMARLVNYAAATAPDVSEQYFENALVYDNFRIFYTLNGEHALLSKFKVDNNENLVPDYVEDVMTELIISDKLLQSFGFDLLKLSNNLYNHLDIKYIDVFLSNYNNSKERSGYFYGNKPEKERSILNNIASTDGKSILLRVHQIGRRNKKTIPHELFHAYQYSYSALLNDWFVEGSAVWFEQALTAPKPSMTALPTTYTEFESDVLNRTYAASAFWTRLTTLCSDVVTINIPEELSTNTTYLFSTGETALPKQQLPGVNLMLQFFKALGHESDVATNDLRRAGRTIDRYRWTIPQSKASANNVYMARALLTSIRSDCISGRNTLEVMRLLEILDTFVSNSLH